MDRPLPVPLETRAYDVARDHDPHATPGFPGRGDRPETRRRARSPRRMSRAIGRGRADGVPDSFDLMERCDGRIGPPWSEAMAPGRPDDLAVRAPLRRP